MGKLKKFFSPFMLILACVGSHEALAAQTWQKIRFGVDATYPPFEYKTPQGKLAGFDIDLGNAICAELKAECVWVENSFDGLIPALKARKFDAVLSAMSITEKRKQSIAFSDKLYNTPAYIVTGKESGLTPDAKSLQGKLVGVQSGSVFETYAKKYWQGKGVKIVAYPDSSEGYADLIVGRLDAVLDDASVQTLALLDKPEGKRFVQVNQRVYDPEIFGPGTGIGLNKEDETLRQALNQAIAAIRSNGTYERIAKRYFTFDVYGD
ncbi:ABC transporter substrate-binding protein [Brenneria rubrifaciens]|uniref:ABC transporter substrate-binding protein n=1 Tax=Brenneria rubrifaciens TaxID=55213 RepID=A0A4P8QSS2_9GAMM|nr:ABC transporter substrate-binding protein [Brenneria rubrifaciens]QCR08420.1 ABC transporter substrate-binding protein [Brenneria rubrifaciens]